MKPTIRFSSLLSLLTAGSLLVLTPARGQLLTNLQAFPPRLDLGDPEVGAADGIEGPKGIASADFNRDGSPDLAVSNLDGTVTLLLGRGDGEFEPPVHLQTD
ncbi:MAG: VCBS repeat-containing protein, partial [Akkermansiaceae bacterium]|nr:VCBS repeat-containing protein [Akkermansiaceae bacterium]